MERAEQRAAGYEPDPEPDDAWNAVIGKDHDALDILDVLEGMSEHFHEHHDALLRWSWKLFCAKWARLIKASAEQRKEREERERRQAAGGSTPAAHAW